MEGTQGLLTVTVSSYDNRNVRCFSPPTGGRATPPRYESCTSLLARLPWNEREWAWSNQFPSAHGMGVKLPLTLSSGDQRCRLFVSMRDLGYEYLRWTDLWAAAIAAQEMCVKRRELGAGVELGRQNPTLFATIRKDYVPARRSTTKYNHGFEQLGSRSPVRNERGCDILELHEKSGIE
ncbi:MAG: hypothetical protein Q9210_003176 [Variospora velana]